MVIYYRYLKIESGREIFVNDKVFANIVKIFCKRIKVGLKYMFNDNLIIKIKYTCSSSLYFYVLVGNVCEILYKLYIYIGEMVFFFLI